MQSPKKGTVKKTVKKTMSPNSSSYKRDEKTDSGTYKSTNAKGKYDYINTRKSKVKGDVVKDVNKQYSAFKVPTYTVSSSGTKVQGNKVTLGKDVVNYKKSIDTTGYAKGKPYFTEVTKKKVPGSGNMYSVTSRKVGRKAVKPILDKMKKAASKPIKKTIK